MFCMSLYRTAEKYCLFFLGFFLCFFSITYASVQFRNDIKLPLPFGMKERN